MAGFTGGAFSPGGKLLVGGIKPEKLKPVWTVPAPIAGHVILWSPETNAAVAIRNTQIAKVTSERVGGFRTIPRPQLRPIVAWDGHPAVEVQIVGQIGAWGVPESVAGELVDLRSFGAKVDGEDPARRPPTVRAIGKLPDVTDGVPTWVVSSLEVDELEHVRPSGAVQVAQVTVGLLQWVDPDIAVRVAKTPKAKARTHTWRKGDTLHKLAKRYLGKSSRYPEFRRANPSIKKWSTVDVGEKIKVPPK
ncbi:MAG: LysM peptidoglycan-binding domain-containing protein [Solirubrobacteraceae bacterium]